MTKIKNKGFSLIEIVIAIALLTILLVPIIQQISLNGRTNRMSKQQQKVNEEAVYRLEQFQSETLPNLLKLDTTAASSVKTCYVFDTDGAQVINPVTSAKLSVTYNATKYNLGTNTIGTADYTEEVIMDDLSTKLMSIDENTNTGYKISYDRTSADLSKYSGASVSIGTGAAATSIAFDFQLTSEGSIVSYDSEGFINAVVVSSTTNYVTNPNSVNLGNIQNLQLDSVALIQADALLYDEKANTDFMAQIMDWLKVNDPDTWDQTVNSQTNSNFLKDNNATISKVTKIYIDKTEYSDGSDTAKYYYTVMVDVYYYPEVSIDGTPLNLQAQKYTVFSQKFYTKDAYGNPKAPDVYMEYEPYVTDNTSTGFAYADVDTILIDNYVPDAKVYIIAPGTTQAEAVGSLKCVRTTDGFVRFKRSASSTSELRVKVVLANASNDVTSDPDDGKAKEANIYTNIEMTKFSVSNGVATSLRQGNILLNASGVDSDGNAKISTVIESIVGKYTDILDRDGNSTRSSCHNVNAWSDDVREESRLYTVTVNIKSLDTSYSSVSLTGARGDN